MNSPLIWWLSQDECEAIGAELPESFPAHIREAYASRRGRSGRGRLWCAPSIVDDVSVSGWESPLGRWAERCGGIVVYPADVIWYLEAMPGLITDLQLRRWLPDREP